MDRDRAVGGLAVAGDGKGQRVAQVRVVGRQGAGNGRVFVAARGAGIGDGGIVRPGDRHRQGRHVGPRVDRLDRGREGLAGQIGGDHNFAAAAGRSRDLSGDHAVGVQLGDEGVADFIRGRLVGHRVGNPRAVHGDLEHVAAFHRSAHGIGRDLIHAGGVGHGAGQRDGLGVVEARMAVGHRVGQGAGGRLPGSQGLELAVRVDRVAAVGVDRDLGDRRVAVGQGEVHGLCNADRAAVDLDDAQAVAGVDVRVVGQQARRRRLADRRAVVGRGDEVVLGVRVVVDGRDVDGHRRRVEGRRVGPVGHRIGKGVDAAVVGVGGVGEAPVGDDDGIGIGGDRALS